MGYRFIFFLASSLIAAFTSSTTTDVLVGISAIDYEVTSFEDTVTEFPLTGGTLGQVLDLHHSATSFIYTIHDVAATVNNLQTTISGTNRTAMYTAMEDIVPRVKSCVATLVGKKATFAAIGTGRAPAVVGLTLHNIKRAVVDFETACLSIIPPEDEGKVKAIISEVKGALDEALAVYDTK